MTFQISNNLNVLPYMHGFSEKQFKSKTMFDLNNNIRQIKMKLVATIDQLHDNSHFTLYGEN